MNKFVCDHPWTHFEVNNPNGDVTMCCDNGTVLGNVNEASVTDIWNGEAYQEVRRRMRDDGAHAICPHTCPVLHGCKTYQNLGWHSDIPAETLLVRNARLNDAEYAAGKLALESLPRWMRFAYSYACNLDCYHCYQRDMAKTKLKVPDSFLQQVYDLAKYYQVIYFFGGEPFLYKPMLDMMEKIGVDGDCRWFFITNATLLNERIFTMLRQKRIGHFAVSLDAATESSFDILRRRDAKAPWATVIENVRKIAALRREMGGYSFTTSMTLNSVNHAEIRQFVDMSMELGAEPLILLVSNPFETTEFQKDFLLFTTEQFAVMERDIKSSLTIVRAAGLGEATRMLEQLQQRLAAHRRTGNNALRFRLHSTARRWFRRLPAGIQSTIRKAVR